MIDHKHRFLISFFSYGEQRGVPAEKLARSAGVDLSLIENEGAAVITNNQMNNLWKNACKFTNDPLFGLHLGESMQLSALGIVGEIVQNSNTVGLALERAAGFLALVTDIFKMEVMNLNNTVKIKFITNPVCLENYEFATHQIIDLSMVFTMNELKGLILKQIKPVKITLNRKEILHTEEYDRILGCRPITGMEHNQLIFDGDFWETRIVTPDYELLPILMNKATKMMEKLPVPQSFTEKVKQYVWSNSYLGVPTLEDVAANFNTSTRTLQRKLSSENTSFLELANEIRKNLALHYIKVENRSVKEASHMLGYNETSAFTRAFKRWTGTTPAAYQAL